MMSDAPETSISKSEVAPAPLVPSAKEAANESPSEQTGISSTPMVTPAETGIELQPVQPAAPKLAVHDMPPAKAVTLLKINSPKPSVRRSAPAAKAMAPRQPVAPQPADFVPPAFMPQIKPELALQLPITLPVVPAPVQLPGNAAQQAAKIDAAQLVTRRNPTYPPMAKAAGISGSVELHFTIDAEGAVRGVTLVTGNQMLAGAAIEAVHGWRYRPARRNGVPFATEANTVFVFKQN
jgi:TonB family protein